MFSYLSHRQTWGSPWRRVSTWENVRWEAFWPGRGSSARVCVLSPWQGPREDGQRRDWPCPWELSVAFRGRQPTGPGRPGLRAPSSTRQWVLAMSKPRGHAWALSGWLTSGCLPQMHSIRNLPSTRFREQQREDGVEDMTQLE